MRANVQFAYWAEDNDGVTWELTVRAEVVPGTPAVTNRRPEHCYPAEPAELVDIEVLDENLRPLTEEQVGARFERGTWERILREVLESRVELPDPN